MIKYKATMNVVLALIAVLAWGCYAETRFSGDGSSDAAGDDAAAPDVAPDVVPEPLPDSPCIEQTVPRFESLEYQDTVQANMAFTMTVRHEGAMNVTASTTLGGSIIEITLSGLMCTCDPCEIGTPTVFETMVYFYEGLPAGEYTILIQGQAFPLHVVGECRRSLMYPESSSVTCPDGEIRIDQAASIGFYSYGMGCGCGGYAETTTTLRPPVFPERGRLDIGAVEVVCDPSRCCMECACIDTYEVALSVSYPREGFYTNYVNDTYLCSTVVFGEDGCSDWRSPYGSVTSYTSEVYYGDPAGFDLSFSTGFCCEGTPYVVEERPDTYRVNLQPMVTVCQGACCYDCDCMDMFQLHHDIYGLSIGTYQVCVEGAACYEVHVIGYD
jgi:hypothetical protein